MVQEEEEVNGSASAAPDKEDCRVTAFNLP